MTLKAISLNLRAFQNVDESLKKDKKFVLEVVKLTKKNNLTVGELYSLSDIDENLTKNRAFVIDILKINPLVFSYINKDLQEDKSFILELLKSRDIDGKKIDIDKELFKDEKFVADVVRLTGRGLQYATKEQQDDKMLVLEAIKHNLKAQYFISDRLQKDEDVLNAIAKIRIIK